MLGYTEKEVNQIANDLCELEVTSEQLKAIQKALDLIEGLLAEGYFD